MNYSMFGVAIVGVKVPTYVYRFNPKQGGS